MDISKNEIHVYKAFSETSENKLNYFLDLLDTDEKNKADRFKFAKHRNNFISFRAYLRIILSEYLNTHPAKITFSYADKGKPFISDSEIKFNISHSDNFAVYAVTSQIEIGIDTEKIKELPDALSIAKNYFSEMEVKQFSEVNENNYKQAFYNCWTRKEAFIKAIGEGLSFPLADFSVSFMPGEAPEMKWIKDKPEESLLWTIINIDLEKEFISSLAIRSNQIRLIEKEIPFRI
jgi:4'-phosphopantetheinyl transferase